MRRAPSRRVAGEVDGTPPRRNSKIFKGGRCCRGVGFGRPSHSGGQRLVLHARTPTYRNAAVCQRVSRKHHTRHPATIPTGARHGAPLSSPRKSASAAP